jgi:hypothetical protein
MKLYQEVNRHNEQLMYLPAAVRDELLEAAPKDESSDKEWLL